MQCVKRAVVWSGEVLRCCRSRSVIDSPFNIYIDAVVVDVAAG